MKETGAGKRAGARPAQSPEKIRRKSDAARKALMLRVRVTDDQKRILTAAAEKSGLDVSGFLRSVGIERARELGVE
jgi:uncharacterized protein (DUF1778 family)